MLRVYLSTGFFLSSQDMAPTLRMFVPCIYTGVRDICCHALVCEGVRSTPPPPPPFHLKSESLRTLGQRGTAGYCTAWYGIRQLHQGHIPQFATVSINEGWPEFVVLFLSLVNIVPGWTPFQDWRDAHNLAWDRGEDRKTHLHSLPFLPFCLSLLDVKHGVETEKKKEWDYSPTITSCKTIIAIKLSPTLPWSNASNSYESVSANSTPFFSPLSLYIVRQWELCKHIMGRRAFFYLAAPSPPLSLPPYYAHLRSRGKGNPH